MDVLSLLLVAVSLRGTVQDMPRRSYAYAASDRQSHGTL